MRPEDAVAFRWRGYPLISPYMLEQNRLLHVKGKWGGSGYKHATDVLDWAKFLGAKNALDYGCGKGTLKKLMNELRPNGLQVHEYDPAVKGKESIALPQYDMVVCTDVMEHVEESLVDNVLAHMCELSTLGAYVTVATRPANKSLPDGQNAHITLRDSVWWTDRVTRLDWRVPRISVRQRKAADGGGEKDVTFWIEKERA